MSNLEGFAASDFPLEIVNAPVSNEVILKDIYAERLREKEILESFTPEQIKEISRKQRVLSSLAYFVGKDFDMPVLLNEPGGGWYWNEEANHVKIDPKDILEKPLDYLRFVICHEAGHRRISRIIGVIPPEVWQEKGFSFMMNAVEDCRDNNFVAEAYPRFKKQMVFSYDLLTDERETLEKIDETLTFKPKFVQAGFEYMHQWLKEVKGEEFGIDPTLPADVREVVEKTLKAAQDLWWRYPSKNEADTDSELVTAYAKKAFAIAHEQIWPEFKKLIDQDVQRQEVDETLEDIIRKALDSQKEKGNEGGEPSNIPAQEQGEGIQIPKNLADSLSPEQKAELEKAIKEAIDKLGQKTPEQSEENRAETQETHTDSKKENASSIEDKLPPDLKEKIRIYIDSLPEEVKERLHTQAEKKISEIAAKISEDMRGKLIPDQNSEEKNGKDAKGESREQGDTRASDDKTSSPNRAGSLPQRPDTFDMRSYQQRLERLVQTDANIYETYERDLVPLIDRLENELRDILISHSAASWKTGFRTGKRINIQRRIQEKGQHIAAMESKAWEKREKPNEVDYALTLLADLSGSMRQEGRIKETFKALVVLVESLNRLGIRTEVIGFNDELMEYQKFGEELSNTIRTKMSGMFKEVDNSCCSGCGNEHSETDIGWATEQAAERLLKEKVDKRILIVLSDARRAESPKHPAGEYDFDAYIKKTRRQKDIGLIGLGVGKGTGEIGTYFPLNVTNATVDSFVQAFPDLVKRVIAEGGEA